MKALDARACTRCLAHMSADSEARPVHVDSRVYRPANSRPSMPGGIRADGTVVPPSEVWWEVEADYAERGPVAALLCPACTGELLDWLHRSGGRT